MRNITESGSFIKICRESKKLSQLELAKKLGFTNAQFISNIECGKSLLPMARMIQIAGILGASPNDIYSRYVKDVFQRLEIKFQKEMTNGPRRGKKRFLQGLSGFSKGTKTDPKK
jgi:transcriptional regulator with XRE-family HTH domain